MSPYCSGSKKLLVSKLKNKTWRDVSPYCSGSKRLLVFKRETKHGEMCHLTAVVVKDYWYVTVKLNMERCVTLLQW